MSEVGEISNLTDSELVEHAKEIRLICKKKMYEVRKKHGVPIDGSLNYRGESKKYLEIDIKSYYDDFAKVADTYIVPFEKEISKRIKGNEDYYSELTGKLYKFNLLRLKYLEDNIPHSFIGRVTPRYTNPGWFTHLRKLRRYYNQEDYKEVEEKREIEKRENKLKNILDE